MMKITGAHSSSSNIEEMKQSIEPQWDFYGVQLEDSISLAGIKIEISGLKILIILQIYQ